MRRVNNVGVRWILWAFALIASPTAAAPLPTAALTGFVVHFDSITSVEEATALVQLAAAHGAGVINIVPPAHIRESALAQRGFLEYADNTGTYELTQYTPEALRLWHEWLGDEYGSIARVNRAYRTSFASLDDVPMPTSDTDRRFSATGGHRAYFDFVRVFDGWLVERYSRSRRIWHEVSGRKDVPFILQFSGFAAEKLASARPGAAAALAPRAWIYEFLKDKYAEKCPDNPGKIVTANRRVRAEAAGQLGSAFAGECPCFGWTVRSGTRR